MVYGEGGHLPGLIIDIYGKTALIQAHSMGMDADKEKIVDALLHVLGKNNLKHMFCHTGEFSVYAPHGGARSVAPSTYLAVINYPIAVFLHIKKSCLKGNV